MRCVPKWNGSCTRDGKFGLYAPTRGGLELLELRKGSTGDICLYYSYFRKKEISKESLGSLKT